MCKFALITQAFKFIPLTFQLQLRPGRFISWDNKAHKHCVLTSSDEPRRFLGPVVLDAKGTGLIPVVDILLVKGPCCLDVYSCRVLAF